MIIRKSNFDDLTSRRPNPALIRLSMLDLMNIIWCWHKQHLYQTWMRKKRLIHISPQRETNRMNGRPAASSLTEKPPLVFYSKLSKFIEQMRPNNSLCNMKNQIHPPKWTRTLRRLPSECSIFHHDYRAETMKEFPKISESQSSCLRGTQQNTTPKKGQPNWSHDHLSLYVKL